MGSFFAYLRKKVVKRYTRNKNLKNLPSLLAEKSNAPGMRYRIHITHVPGIYKAPGFQKGDVFVRVDVECPYHAG